MQIICKYYTIYTRNLSGHLQILVILWGLGTNHSWIPRDACSSFVESLLKYIPTTIFFIFWFECLLQPFTNKWVYSFERALSPVGSLLSNPLCPYSTEASNYHSNRSMWCLHTLSETKHLLGEKKNHTHTLICNTKFYFMAFMKANHAFK